MSGRVSGFSVFPLPTHGVNILPSPKETSKQANFLIRSKGRSRRVDPLHFGSRDDLWTGFTDAQKLPKALIFGAQAVVLNQCGGQAISIVLRFHPSLKWVGGN
ncbi:MAG TPA: hypothetical protein VIS96_07525 [Terrimicrobiaceae bacterium]